MPDQEGRATPRTRSHVLARRLGMLAASLLAVFVLAVAAGLPVFVFPQLDEPRKVDAVFVLGRPLPEKIAVAEDLIERGFSDTLLVAVDDYGIDDATNVAPCHEPRAYEVVCHVPDPFTTQGEARWFAGMAQARGWDSVMIVTSTYHVSRARVLFDRCFAGELLAASDGIRFSPLDWSWHYVYQTGAFAKVLLTPGC